MSHAAQSSFYNDEHTAFRKSLARFFAQSQHDGATSTLTAAAELELLGIGVPESCGGAGVVDLRFTMVVVEEALRAGAASAAALLALQSMVVVPALAANEDWAGRAEVLAGISDGSAYVSVAGTHHPLPATVVDDGIVVDGTAVGVLAASTASHLIVCCHTNSGAAVTTLIDASAEGVSVAEEAATLGGRSVGAAAVVFTGVHVSSGRILGSADSGCLLRTTLVGDLELFLAALAIAGAGAAISWTGEYASQRKVFGRELSSFENTRYVMSGLNAELITAQSALRVALISRTDGPLPSPQSAALAVTGMQLYRRAVDKGLQLHGGYGYMHEYLIAQAFADAEFFGLLAEHLGVATRCGEGVDVSL